MDTLTINKIVVPLDFSKTSLKALDIAVEMAKLNNAKVVLIHTIEPVPVNAEPGYFDTTLFAKSGYDPFIEDSDKNLANIAEGIKKQGIGEVEVHTIIGRIHSEINAVAEKHKADIIVMGTHGVSGFQEYFAGSNTFRVIRNSSIPVLSVNEKSGITGFRNILVPFRDNPHSREKVDYAIDLARMYNATIHVLAVDTEGGDEHYRKMVLEAEQIEGIVSNSDIKCVTKIVAGAYVADVILSYAKAENADLIISMADLEKMNITEYFTGPFAQQIVNHSPVPVLSIRPRFNTDTVDMRFY
jgi:nucleotide-binding universal stress UspA family protein